LASLAHGGVKWQRPPASRIWFLAALSRIPLSETA
jgi:hypothetical protein